jgi:nucleotide-binding universal stress UspA family protein
MKRLLVGIDFGTTTNAVLENAGILGRQLNCDVLLCHAVEYVPKGYETDLAEEREIRKHFDKRLQEVAADIPGSRALPATIGSSVNVLLDLAEKHKVDALLVGVSNRGAIERVLLGSTAERLVRRSKWPVFLRHPDDPGGVIDSIICAIDYSEHATRSLQAAIALARRLGADLQVLHVCPEPFTYPGLPDISVYHVSTPEPTAHAQAQMDKFLEGIDTHGVRVSTCLRSGAPSATIVKTCHEQRPDLLVIGKHGKGGIVELLMGGVATDILRDLPCSMLVIGKRELKSE